MRPTAILLVASLVLGCGTRALDPASIVCVQVPATAAAFDPLAADPDRRCPEGSHLALLEPGPQGVTRAVLASHLHRAGFPSLSADATYLVFAARRDPAARWAIYEMELRTREHRLVLATERDCYAPAYLADDRIVYVGDNRDGGCDLYTCARDGRAVERITYHQGTVRDPTALADGRVLYVREDRSVGGARAQLMTVNVDGTLARASTPMEAALLCKPVEVSGGQVAVLADRRPALASLAWPNEPGAIGALEMESLASWDDQAWLVAVKGIGAPAPLALALFTPASGAVVNVLAPAPGLHLVDALRARPRTPARTHVSTVNAARKTGEMLCLDTSRSEPPRTVRAQLLRVRTRSAAGQDVRVLGEAPIAADGSVFIEVPADQPIQLEVLDHDRAMLGQPCAWIWVRPGERRGCVGCHESPALAPENRVPLAVAAGAVPVLGPPATQVASSSASVAASPPLGARSE